MGDWARWMRWSALAAPIALVACGGEPDEAAERDGSATDGRVAMEAAPQPYVIAETTPGHVIDVEIAPDVMSLPAAAARLRSEVEARAAALRTAAGDRDAPVGAEPLTLTERWTLAARTPRLLSVSGAITIKDGEAPARTEPQSFFIDLADGGAVVETGAVIDLSDPGLGAAATLAALQARIARGAAIEPVIAAWDEAEGPPLGPQPELFAAASLHTAGPDAPATGLSAPLPASFTGDPEDAAVIVPAAALAQSVTPAYRDAFAFDAEAAQTAPFRYDVESQSFGGSVTIDAAVAATPLGARFALGGVRTLVSFRGEAEMARVADAAVFQPWSYETTVSATMDTPEFVSAIEEYFEYTGGAHPNSGFGAMVWDKPAGAEIDITQVLAEAEVDGPTLTAVAALLDEAHLKAFHAKLIEAKVYEPGDPELANEQPAWIDGFTADAGSFSTFTFTPSEDGETIAALTFWYEPYQIGPYAEGPYVLTLPADEIRDVLAPRWAARLAPND